MANTGYPNTGYPTLGTPNLLPLENALRRRLAEKLKCVCSQLCPMSSPVWVRILIGFISWLPLKASVIVDALYGSNYKDFNMGLLRRRLQNHTEPETKTGEKIGKKKRSIVVKPSGESHHIDRLVLKTGSQIKNEDQVIVSQKMFKALNHPSSDMGWQVRPKEKPPAPQSQLMQEDGGVFSQGVADKSSRCWKKEMQLSQTVEFLKGETVEFLKGETVAMVTPENI
ncbi:hypothetical protein DAPPUDRAFT_332123 [Daphnia pulex]|uniref:Uncharacterized protein n=1 Tax=Daphnia pulex TaxID=6669 RepID=E9HP17_DAPPU|nr:hypothetical protein DAPPUDRAFT_332123 [Daphnia pulex]|eukprot:EFX66484.1 hypothetical protein DAPPUDRAFT_332123 [Daphnia pulex]